MNQYRWESAFFLAVLFSGIAVVWRAIDRADDLQRRQQNFLAAVSHELKSPLASLQLSTETLLLRELEPQDREHLLLHSVEDVRRLRGMVENILETSSIEDGRVDHQPTRLELRGAVEQAVADLGMIPALERGVVEIVNEVEDGQAVRADAIAVGTILRNLVKNAVEASESVGGGVVRISTRRRRQTLELSVSDTGEGFDPGEAKKLFEKFYRPGDELRRGKKGSGLGLYLVRKFAELDGAVVQAESAGPHEGAVFRVSWPRFEGESGHG